MDEDRIEVVDKYDNVREQNPFGTIYDKNSNNEKKKKNLKLGGLIAAVIFVIVLLIIIIGLVGRRVIHTPLHWNSNKLPTTYSPQSYNITLDIDASNKLFSGYETINLELRNKTNLIVLHGDSIELLYAEIGVVDSFQETSNVKFITADQISYDAVNGYILMRFEVLKNIPLYNGITLAQLRLKFTGTIREDNRGIFITTYDDQNGNEQAIIATQFEPTNARLAFPCFDEPNIRANFTLTLIASNDFVTFVSSALVDKKTSDTNVTTVSFKTTPKINPSIFAFAICNFQKTTDKVDGVDVSVYVAEGKLLQAVTALSNVKKIVTFYNQYFGIVMPSKKLDIICIPDFSPKGKIDGTYNWGLITMLETDVLIDQYSLTFQTQQNMLNLAREISRQWIGSLFGIKWWNSIWIIDGLSGFLQYLVVDNLQPKWDIWRNFRDDYENALFYDSLKYTHPLEIDESKISNQYDIESLYDDITKNKGASIFHMLYDRLESIEIGLFKTCVSDFLKNFAGSSVNSNDLWSSFQKSSDFPVKDFLNDWTFKEGYPIIHFENVSNTTLRAIQEQFFMYTTKEESKYWWISLTVQYDSKISAVSRFKFNHTSKSSTFNSFNSNNSYFIVNHLRVGFYRIAYTPSMIEDITGNIKKNGINYYQAVDISSILYDTLSIRRSSEDAFLVSISNLFELALLVSNSTDYSLWNSVTDVFSILERLLDYPDSSSTFYKFVRHFTAPLFNKIGFLPKTNETTEINILRSVILPFVVKFNVGGSSTTAYQMFKNFVSNSTYNLHPDIRLAIYIAGAKYGNADDWDWIKKKYQSTDSKVEALRLLAALSSTEDEELLQTAFNLILASEIDYHDIIPFITFLSVNHKNESWAFFESNWNFFVSNFPSQLDSLIILFSRNFVSHEQYVALKDLIRKYQYPLSDPLKQNYALIESNVGFFLNYASGVNSWLDEWDSK